jgi:hypothetical protein
VHCILTIHDYCHFYGKVEFDLSTTQIIHHLNVSIFKIRLFNKYSIHRGLIGLTILTQAKKQINTRKKPYATTETI